MKKLLLPLILGLIGLAGGVGAALFLQPTSTAPEPEAAACPPPETPVAADQAPPPRVDATALEDREYVALTNQFIIPIVTETRVAGLVVLALTIETKMGQGDAVYAREPKLRDLFLQTLFDHSAIGRFDGEFATASNLAPLRDELTIVARRVLGEDVSDVLITDILRQDG